MAYSITTKDVSSITTTTAISGGSAIDASGYKIFTKGITWKKGLSQSPEWLVDFGAGIYDEAASNFDLAMTELDPSTDYTVKAFLRLITLAPGNIQFKGWGTDLSTLIMHDGFVQGVDVSAHPIPLLTGDVQYAGWGTDQSTMIFEDGLLLGVDIWSGDPYYFSGDVQYQTWDGFGGIISVSEGALGITEYTLIYGAGKNFSTLSLPPVRTPICLDCYWLNSHLSPSTGLITDLIKDSSSITYPWTCGAFNNDSSVKSIPDIILNGLNPHDVSIAGQLYDSWEDYFPVYTKVVPEIIKPIVNILEAGTLPQVSKYMGDTADVSAWPGITPGLGYLKIPALVEGTGVTFDYGFLDLSSGGSYIDTITINASGGGGTFNPVSQDASIVALRLKDTQQDASIIRIDGSINALFLKADPSSLFNYTKIDKYTAKTNLQTIPNTELAWYIYPLTPDVCTFILIGYASFANIFPGIAFKGVFPNVELVQTDLSVNNVIYTREITANSDSWAQKKAVNATKISTSIGNPGDMAYDNTNFYICVSTNKWKATFMYDP
jgi:hypothetical protein